MHYIVTGHVCQFIALNPMEGNFHNEYLFKLVIYAYDIRHVYIKATIPCLLSINGYVQIPTSKNKRKSPLLWYISIKTRIRAAKPDVVAMQILLICL